MYNVTRFMRKHGIKPELVGIGAFIGCVLATGAAILNPVASLVVYQRHTLLDLSFIKIPKTEELVLKFDDQLPPKEWKQTRVQIGQPLVKIMGVGTGMLCGVISLVICVQISEELLIKEERQHQLKLIDQELLEKELILDKRVQERSLSLKYAAYAKQIEASYLMDMPEIKEETPIDSGTEPEADELTSSQLFAFLMDNGHTSSSVRDLCRVRIKGALHPADTIRKLLDELAEDGVLAWSEESKQNYKIGA